MKTYREVIDETVEYYKTNPFGYNEGTCVYYGDNGEMCAVGRCLKDPEFPEPSDGIGILIDDKGMSVFKEEYQHLDSKDFWQALQIYHDYSAEVQPIDVIIKQYDFLIANWGNK